MHAVFLFAKYNNPKCILKLKIISEGKIKNIIVLNLKMSSIRKKLP